jgi:hypothetical protein
MNSEETFSRKKFTAIPKRIWSEYVSYCIPQSQSLGAAFHLTAISIKVDGMIL